MTARTRLFLYALRVCAALGCSSPKPDAAAAGPCPIGDTSAPLEIALVARTPDGAIAPLADGAAIALIEPPQGGEVVFVGVRAKNLDACGVTIAAALLDPQTSAPIGLDARAVDLAAAHDGWAETAAPGEIGSFANVPVCPNRNATRPLDGAPYLLEVTVRDRDARTASARITVVPTCAERALCPRECGD